MATTTNYGWTTPDDTALVKDGASAIRSLGTAVDTTTKNLNPSTTLGDIEYRSSTANVNTRLGIGSTGNVLTVAGGVPTWAAPSSGALTLIKTQTIGSGVSSVEVTGAFSTTYDAYKIVVSGGVASANCVIAVKLGSATTDYESVAIYAPLASTGSGNASRETFDSWRITSGGTANVISVNFDLTNPFLSKYTLINGAWINGDNAGTFNGVQNTTTSFTAFTLTPESATLTGGTIRVYGYQNS